jgi:hypothetical protein
MATYTARAAAFDGVLTEKAWAQVVVDYATLTGWLVYRTWRSIHSPSGFPDLTLVRAERLVFAELKTERGKLSPSQKTWLERLGRVPGAEVYGPWRPSHWVEIRGLLL